MTVTTEATVKVNLTDFVAALKAVLPHHNRVKTGDALAQHAVRFIFAGKWLFIGACNAQTTGISRVQIREDTRGASGKLDGTPGDLDKDDQPVVFDLQPRRVKHMLQLFKPNAASDEATQQVVFDIEIDADGSRVLDATDRGGLYSDGESHRWPCEEPSRSFPDLLAVHGVAVANDQSDTRARPLEQDGKTLALFKAAGEVYGKLKMRTTGPEGSGWIITTGPFVGTVASIPGGDGGKRDDELQMTLWRELLPMRELKAV